MMIRKLLVCLAASVCLTFAAGAEEGTTNDVHVADGVICGTAEQAKSFVAHHPDDFASPGNDVESRNGDKMNDKDECLVAGIAYIPGKELDRVRHKDVTYAVQEILLVAVATPYGLQKVKPDLVYTIVKVDEEGA